MLMMIIIRLECNFVGHGAVTGKYEGRKMEFIYGRCTIESRPRKFPITGRLSLMMSIRERHEGDDDDALVK